MSPNFLNFFFTSEKTNFANAAKNKYKGIGIITSRPWFIMAFWSAMIHMKNLLRIEIHTYKTTFKNIIIIFL